MTVRLKGVRSVSITGEFIKLDALLKYASVVSTGGEAKHLIQSGDIYLNGGSCVLRGKKIRPGDVVRYDSGSIIVRKRSCSPVTGDKK